MITIVPEDGWSIRRAATHFGVEDGKSAGLNIIRGIRNKGQDDQK